MRRLPSLPLALAAGLAVAGCSTSPCQELGQKLCSCTGLTSDTCKTQVETQLKSANPNQDTLDQCQRLLDRCNQPAGADFCEWLKTPSAQIKCGLAPDPATVGTTP
jgi:hypothetical protein